MRYLGDIMPQIKHAAELLAKEDEAQFEQQKACILEFIQKPETRAVDILHGLVMSYENPVLIKIALTVLSEIDNNEAVAVLSHCMFEHPKRLHRGDAARALGYTRKERAIAPLKRILQTAPEAAADLPISEALWAVMSLCQLGILEADEEWLGILALWKEADVEARILARAILECIESQKASTLP